MFLPSIIVSAEIQTLRNIDLKRKSEADSKERPMTIIPAEKRSLQQRTQTLLIFLLLIFVFTSFLSSSLQTESNTAKKFRFVTQDNLWFTDESGSPPLDGYIRKGRNMNPVTPLLGFSDSSNLKAKAQELQWLLRYTRRNGSGLVISQEWFHRDPQFRIDLLIRTVFLPLIQQHGGQVKWDNSSMTYGELNLWANRCALYLLSRGLKKGDVTSILMENHPELFMIYLAIAKIGAIAAVINTNMREKSLLHCQNTCP